MNDLSGHYWSRSSVLPYPFVPYDKNTTLESNSALSRKSLAKIPEVLFHSACEFEVNLNVNATSWSVEEWRKMAERISRNIYAVNPFYPKKNTTKTGDDIIDDELFEDDPYSHKDEALVMSLVGTMESTNCDFALSLNATAFRTDWEQTKYKATLYSVYMMLASLAQIVILLRQIIHSQTHMVARVSMLCVGWQSTLDALLCLEHVFLCLMVPPVSTAFCEYSFTLFFINLFLYFH